MVLDEGAKSAYRARLRSIEAELREADEWAAGHAPGEHVLAVLGGARDGRVAIVVSLTPGAIERGLSAVQIVREAAEVIGGGGGGRDDAAQAGGRDPERLDEALETARQAIERGLGAGA